MLGVESDKTQGRTMEHDEYYDYKPVTFRVDEVIDLTLRNVKIVKEVPLPDGGTNYFTVVIGSGKLDVDPSEVGIVRKVPADGPPEVGDVWQDRDGNFLFGAAHYPDFDDKEDSKGMNKDGWRLVLVPYQLGEQGSPLRPEWAIDRYGPLTRVYRPEKTIFSGDDDAPLD